MNKPLAFALAVAVVGLAACSSGGGAGACSNPSKCSADPKPTKDAITLCQKINAGVCGSQYSDFNSCAAAQTVCAADNTTDTAATVNAITANCANQDNAYVACCSANPTACQ